MKKLFLLLFFIGFSISGTYAQSASVDTLWGNKFKMSYFINYIIGSDNEGTYVYCTVFPHSYIAKYDLHLNQVLFTPVKFDETGKVVVSSINMFYDKMYVFYSVFDKKAKIKTLYVRSIDKTTLALNNDKKKICEFSYEKIENNGSFDILFSEDKAKMMICYSPPKKGENKQFGYQVYGKDMELLWEKNITLPYNDELFWIEKNKVDNNGNAYLSGILFKDKAKQKWQENYEYHILSYTDKGETKNEYTIASKDKVITDMQIGINKKGDIVCTGLYLNKGTINRTGIFYMNIDTKTKEIKNENYKELEKDFFSEPKIFSVVLSTGGKNLGYSKELYKYALNELVMREDGGVILVAEQFSVSTSSSPSSTGGTPNTSQNYNYNDIIIVNINPDGSIYWVKKIPKVQLSGSDYYSSYALNITEGKLYFIFNDDPKNLNKTSDKILGCFPTSKESALTLVTVDGKGEIKKEVLFGVKETGVIICPKIYKQISSNERIIYGHTKKGSNGCYAKLTFK